MFQVLLFIVLFLIGLAVGSFVNSIIYRLKTGESIAKARSHCPHCKKTLSSQELVPLLSFILQKGRCRYCKKRISLQYPLVELATGILFVLSVLYLFGTEPGGFETAILLLFWLFAISCLIIIFVYDLKHYIIPNQVIYLAILVAVFYKLFEVWNFRIWELFERWGLGIESLGQIFSPFVSAIVAGAFFLVIVLISKGRWMGMGDVKLAVFMGLVLDWPNILAALFLAFLVGALVSIVLVILKKKTFKSEIPFGPFLAGATIATLFLGDVLINWYLGLLF